MHIIPPVLAIILLAAATARAAEPIVVNLPAQAAVGTAVVTLGDVAQVYTNDADTRDRVMALDIAEIKPREQSVAVSRRAIEFRLQLAGFDPSQVRVVGADSTMVSISRRTVTAEEVVAGVRAELLRRLTLPPESVSVELAMPILVKLPEVPAREQLAITAQPHGKVAGVGRVQMDAAIAVNGEKLLAFPVTLDVRQAGSAGGVVPAGGMTPGAGSGEIVIRARQRVSMQVRSGALAVTAVGKAQNDGRLGQSILVKNVDSMKIINARVVAPGVVEIELGGVP